MEENQIIALLSRLEGKMDQKFEQIDQKFEQIDKRFEQIDQRFEQIDKRFDKIEQRLDRHEDMLQQLIQIVGNTNEKLVEFKEEMKEIANRMDYRLSMHDADLDMLHKQTHDNKRDIYRLKSLVTTESQQP